MRKINFELKHFDELSTIELYEMLKLRSEVFVVEQDCVYLDLDDLDQDAHHVLGYDESQNVVACTRIIKPGNSYTDYSSIGRVVLAHSARKFGFGKLLMKESIKHCRALYPEQDIKISAQCYLLKFYNNLGFQAVGEEYLEDGIPHVGMVHSIKKK